MQQKIVELNEVLDYQQPIPYIVKSTDYMEAGDIPVLTAGKTFILGYTKEKKGIFTGPFPVIIFDDFTTATKLVNFPFKVKSSAMKILLPKANVDIKYIFYFLQTQKFSAVTHKRYWISVCAKTKILLPPMAEQKRIVKKIEELFGVIDEQVKRLEATHAALVSYRQSILQQAFSGKLYKTSTWEEVPLKKCCLPVIKRKDSKDPSEKFLYLDIASIDNKTNKIIEGTPYRGDTAPSRARQIVQKDDVLFSTVRTYLKNIALITDSKYNNQIASTGFCVIRANQKMLLPHFIFYKTLSDAFLSPLNAKQRGSSYPAVRDGDVLSSIIDLPSLPDQKAIVKKIETAFAFADKAQTVITDALEQAKQLKQSILKRAFEGQLVSQDPNDKPVDLTQLKKDKQK